LTPDPHPGYDLPVPTALESLAAIPLFANLSSRQLRKLARSATEDSYGGIRGNSSRCLVLHHDVLRRLVMDDPRMGWSLLLTLAGRVRDS